MAESRKQRVGSALTRLWHWLILLIAVAGAGIAARLAYAAWETATDEVEMIGTALWWGLVALLVAVVLVCLREIWLRIRALRAPRHQAGGDGGG